ncbi:MAG: ABC transporter permease [Rhizobacter sp.]|nr:ABC transporter permease [Chlorobiales bacterium]
MEQFRTILSEFMRDLRSQKLRVFLTLFGIIWGTVAIIVLLAFGEGFRIQTAANMHGLGESITILFPGRTTKAYEGFGIGRGIGFLESDAAYLKSEVSGIESISPEFATWGKEVRKGENVTNSSVTGIYPVYGEMRNIRAERGGRFINDLDLQERRRVAFIGDEIKKRLFGEKNAVGELIYIGGTPYIVVGVMIPKTQNSSYNQRDKDRVFIPASTFSAAFGIVYLANIIYKPRDPMNSEQVSEGVRKAFAKKYKFDPTDNDAIWVWDTTGQDKFFGTFFLAFNAFMGLIGSFTLGVAGIGVANIMYIVVQERIKEIGIKRACGATRGSILTQFLAETFLIIGAGSMIGFAFAIAIIWALQFVPIKDFVGAPVFSANVAVITISILTVIGAVAGFMPARRAANLDVVECLRT